jgi:hypothetical protein
MHAGGMIDKPAAVDVCRSSLLLGNALNERDVKKIETD